MTQKTKRVFLIALFLALPMTLSCERIIELVFQTEKVEEGSQENEVKELPGVVKSPQLAPEGRTGEELPLVETEEELKVVMESASLHMRTLKSALESEDWPLTRSSAKELEGLIGRQCVNLYIKMHPSTPEEFVTISQRFYNSTLRLLVAERYRDAQLARAQFEKMRMDCEGCHRKFRKEKG